MDLRLGLPGPGAQRIGAPFGVVTAGSGTVSIVDYGNHRVEQYSPDGQFLLSWGGHGSGDGQFVQPTHATIDGAGDIYVVDSGNQRVQKFDATGSARTQRAPAPAAPVAPTRPSLTDTKSHFTR